MTTTDRDKQIRSFAVLAQRYCDWYDGNDVCDAAMLLHLQQLLAEMYLNALLLPDADWDQIDENVDCVDPDKRAHSDEMKRIADRMPFDGYLGFFDPHDFSSLETNIIEIESLSDDLCDIARDLRKGVFAYKSGKVEEANWEWRFNFYSHWGRHSVGAIMGLHCWISKDPP